MNILDIFIFSVNAILPLIIIILLGYILKCKSIISKEFLKIGNKVVFRICLPVLLFCNVSEIQNLGEINFSAMLYVSAIIIILAVIGYIVALSTPDVNQKGVMMQCIFRSNFALIGIPLSELLGGSNGIKVAAFLSIFTIPIFNILAVIALSMFVNKSESGSIIKQLKLIAKNPLIIGVLLGIVVLITKNLIPTQITEFVSSKFAFIHTSLNYISRMATPLALLVLGGQFEFSHIKGYKKQIVLATVCRTVLSPLLGIGIAAILCKCGYVDFNASVFAAFIALFGTPVAVSSAIMADEMGNDGKLAAQLVVWTSLISIFTIFIAIFICKLFNLL